VTVKDLALLPSVSAKMLPAPEKPKPVTPVAKRCDTASAVTPESVTPVTSVTPESRTCIVCGASLEGKQASAETCSAKCRTKKRRTEAKGNAA
jgi:hypothetical protein